jgi:hypothetical protein
MSSPTSETDLKREEWEIRPVCLATATALVKQNHYAKGGSNTAVYLHGLFRRDSFWEAECQGVAWWLPPTRSAAEATYPENWQGVLSLSRLMVLPDVPKNGASFLLTHSQRLIDRYVWPCLVTYADEWRGHTGAIYRAANWRYCGLTKPSTVYVRNGQMVAKKAGPKTRTKDEMLALGCVVQGAFRKHKFVHIVGG